MNNRLHLAPAGEDTEDAFRRFREKLDHGDLALAQRETRPTAESILAASDADDDKLNAGIAEDLAAKLADEIPADTTAIMGDKAALERVLEKRRAHKRELQKLLSVTKAKLRQIDGTIKGIEDHLDTLFESEV